MIFISYSHGDKAFVDRLSLRLLKENVKIWRDEYKLSPGDSLSESVLGAIDKASLLCVVLSRSAITSNWVQQEIKTGLLCEGPTTAVRISPRLTEDLESPEVLKDRRWIDFRDDFDRGVSRLLAAIQRLAPVEGVTGTIKDAHYFFHYAIEGGWVKAIYDLALDIVSFDTEEEFCILTRIHFRGNEAATQAGFDERAISSGKAYVLSTCANEFSANPTHVRISADKPAVGSFNIVSEDGALRFDAQYEVKMLGASQGVTTVFDIGALFGQICDKVGIPTAG